MLVTDEPPSESIFSAVVTILRPPEDVSRSNLPVADMRGADANAEQARAPECFHASVVSITEPLMVLRTSLESFVPPAGSALKVETTDALWLGEADKCETIGDSRLIRIRLHHVLRDFETLARLAERFGTASPKRVSVQA